MNIAMRFLLFGLAIVMLINVASAYNPYGEIYTYEVYYDEELLSGTEVAKPVLKIGEPFKVGVNLTVYQEYKVSGKLMELGDGNFAVINGPSEIDEYSSVILKPNESHNFEWTVKPTDNWAGGSMPLNFHYSMVEKGNPEPVVNSEFTIAYAYITNEYHEGESPSTSLPNSSEPESTPGFTILASVLAIGLTATRR